MARYTASELRAMPTLSIGQADDLKIETPDTRVWISRCSVEDGEPYNDKITVERLRDGRWVTVDTYRGNMACTFNDQHKDRPAVGTHRVEETREAFYVCEECARDLGFYDGD